MVLFLRNKKNESVFELEFYIKSPEEGYYEYLVIVPLVLIEPYSILLLKNQSRAFEIIRDFSFLEELNGWLNEVRDPSVADYAKICEELKEILNGED
jgi:hypothetical protein